MNPRLFFRVVFLSLLLIGCGPSSEALTATAVSLTETARPTVTWTPTMTATPTHTPSPTPPPASAQAMIDWRSLDLSDDYKAITLSSIGIDKDSPALSFSDGSEYFIESGFAFTNSDKSTIYGYTMLLPTKTDQDNFDLLLDYLPDVTESQFGYADVTSMKNLEIPGGDSAGITSTYDGGAWQFQEVVFRAGKIGALVFLRQPNSAKQPIDILEWASVYSNSINRPPNPCAVLSVEPVLDAAVPNFEYHAEGFYPFEGRAVLLEGQIQVGDSVKNAVSAQLGQTGESADGDGRISGTVSFLTTDQLANQGISNGVVLPEFTLKVIGYASGCEASMTAAWP